MDNNLKKKIFISYSHKDEVWARKIEKYFNILDVDYSIWSFKNILVGSEFEHEVYTAINDADIAIILISSNYLASDYIRSTELTLIEKRHKANELKVLPIVLSPCLWRHNDFINKIQVFPVNGKSLSEFNENDIDKLLAELIQNIQYLFEKNKKYMKAKIVNDYFIGRNNEIQQIKDCISKSNISICGIYGVGGIGKTALIREVINGLKDGNIWISFQSGNTIGDYIRNISIDLDIDFSMHINNKEYLSKAIQEEVGTKDLIVVLDSCEQDIEMFKFFYKIFENVCPILVGSREAFDFIPKQLYLNPFTNEEVKTFFNHSFRGNTLDQNTLINLENLFRKTNQSPLILRFLDSAIKTKGYKYILNNQNDILENIAIDSYISISTITELNNDQVSSKNDYIDISKDIDAFAKLIAYKGLQPPLSIALLGKWGSGKSTFMDMLENKIHYFSKLNEPMFCKSVVPIKFNAWHYSDTNLWASLVSRIFKELDKYINKDKHEEDKISIYTKLLDSQKERLKLKEAQRDTIVIEIEEHNNRISIIENEKVDVFKDIKRLDFNDIKKEILKDENIKEEYEEIKKSINIKYGQELTDIKNTYYELGTTFGIYKKAIELFYNDENSKVYFYIFIFIFIGLLMGGAYIDISLSYIGSFIGIVTAGNIFLQKYLKNIKPIAKALEKFIKNWEDKEREFAREKENQKIEFQKKIDDKNILIKNIEQELEIYQNDINGINKEIKKIKSGEYLANFIAARNNSDDYKQHLGLVSVVREDFDKLKIHLKELEDDATYNIERIVLYIDDLDRCPDDKVIQVLEAIHLLLAFDLFVVVVGVDSRWIKNSLVNKYGVLSDKDDDKATPNDYLEKIFQIPFKIKALTKDSKNSLISKLLESDARKENQENQNVDKNIDLVEAKISELQNQEEIKQGGNNSIGNQDKNIDEIEKNEYTKMSFSNEEINYIQKLSPYIGDTPRTIKRFINIYRVIKNHQEIQLIMEYRRDDYKLILIILCFVFSDIKYLLDKDKNNMLIPDDIMNIYKNSENDLKDKYVNFILRFTFKE